MGEYMILNVGVNFRPKDYHSWGSNMLGSLRDDMKESAKMANMRITQNCQETNYYTYNNIDHFTIATKSIPVPHPRDIGSIIDVMG